MAIRYRILKPILAGKPNSLGIGIGIRGSLSFCSASFSSSSGAKSSIAASCCCSPRSYDQISLKNRRQFSSSPRFQKQKLVILGSGWGGYEVMRKVNKTLYDVVMVSPNTYFAFTPLLASTAVGTLEFRCALEPVRRYGGQVKSFQAWCDRIDFEKKELELMPAISRYTKRSTTSTVSGSEKSSSSIEEETAALLEDGNVAASQVSYPGTKAWTLAYDKLVIACGAYSQTFNTPGVKEYAHFLKDVKDARRIRSRILECFEQASLPTLTDIERKNILHFVIVGGGPTGIEFAAELHDLLASDMRRHYPELAPLAKITIYDVAERILASFDSELVDYATAKFKRQGVSIKNNRHVTEVRETTMEVKEEGTVPFGLLVWSTGLAPNPLIASIKELKAEERTLSLKITQRMNTIWNNGSVNGDVYAIGDATCMESGKLPATAQGEIPRESLERQTKDRSPPGDFTFKNAGTLAYIGDWNALFDRTSVKDGPKGKEAGKLAWLLWRSAYWSQSLSFRNKASMAFYWFLNWISGRSITRF